MSVCFHCGALWIAEEFLQCSLNRSFTQRETYRDKVNIFDCIEGKVASCNSLRDDRP